MRPYMIIVCICSMAINAVSQVKYEREVEINSREVPALAVKTVSEWAGDQVNWYKEIAADTFSYEAKYKQGGVKYSVEFDPNGGLQDVEYLLDKKAVSRKVWSHICPVLNDDFDSKWKITKVQGHLFPNNPVIQLLPVGRDQLAPDSYEIIVEGKNKGSYIQYEYTFTSEGRYVSRVRLAVDNLINLEF